MEAYALLDCDASLMHENDVIFEPMTVALFVLNAIGHVIDVLC